MKIIAGKYKGMRLTVKSKYVRPTQAVVRKSVFDMLSDSINNAVCLELFAGSGAMGIEALSRGASFVGFVENKHIICRCIEHTLLRFGASKNSYKIFSKNVDAFLHFADSPQDRYDVIFIDPPYSFSESNLEKLLSKIADCSIMQQGAFLILETRNDFTKDRFKRLVRKRFKNYGQTRISIFEFDNDYS